MSTKIGTRYRR